jgi:hypothetical protein
VPLEQASETSESRRGAPCRIYASKQTVWRGPGSIRQTLGAETQRSLEHFSIGRDPPKAPHYPSKLAREGRIRNLVSCFGIEDRGDGGGVVGLVSRPEAIEAQMRKYGAARVG